MKYTILVTLSMLSLVSVSKSQDLFTPGEITDIRDGKTYKTIKVNNTIWLAENMKFKTDQSTIIEANNFGIDIDGYFYPYQQAEEVCPSGFEIPKDSDWKEYIHLVLELRNVPKSAIQNHRHNKKKMKGISMQITNDDFNIFEDPNPLNLKINGTVQGGILIAANGFNFWSLMDQSNDSKYHFHIINNGFNNHSHHHHVKTENKRKIRKFAVRCVKRIED